MTTRARVLEVCRPYAGVGEKPPGSNCTPWGVRQGAPCQAWCAASAMSMYEDAGVVEPCAHVYVPTWAARLHAAGRWSWNVLPDARPGDTIIYTWAGDRQIGYSGDHVGILDHVAADGRLVVWEGNAWQPGGDAWGLQYRSPSLVMGVGLAPFADVLPPATVPKEMPPLLPASIACHPRPGVSPATDWDIPDLFDLPNIATYIVIKNEEATAAAGTIYVTLDDGTGTDGKYTIPVASLPKYARRSIRVDDKLKGLGGSAHVAMDRKVTVAGSYVAEA